ncbi:Hypothetical protein CFV354_0956 [Campylobacter fetus subsp. venerealis NCTC 10354]|nr:Hypothetical protein CFV354_0956 [Campylobacter fetus subsp. venerealis NCTC 10354]
MSELNYKKNKHRKQRRRRKLYLTPNNSIIGFRDV